MRISLIAILLGFSTLANAQLYRQVQPDGTTLYTNKQIKGAEKVDQPWDKISPGQINRQPAIDKKSIALPSAPVDLKVPPPPIGALPPPPPGVELNVDDKKKLESMTMKPDEKKEEKEEKTPSVKKTVEDKKPPAP